MPNFIFGAQHTRLSCLREDSEIIMGEIALETTTFICHIPRSLAVQVLDKQKNSVSPTCYLSRSSPRLSKIEDLYYIIFLDYHASTSYFFLASSFAATPQ
jgi:hypothetical protein